MHHRAGFVRLTTFARLQSLSFFNDLEGQTYPFADLASWLTDAGFANLKQINLRKSPGFSLVLGTKTGRGTRENQGLTLPVAHR